MAPRLIDVSTNKTIDLNHEWGMMIAGLLLVAAKVGKTKKSANTRSSLCV